MERSALVLIMVLFLIGRVLPCQAASKKELAKDRPMGKIEAIAFFNGPMPTGVTISRSARILSTFLNGGIR